MANTFPNIRTTDIIRDSLSKLLDRDLTALTLSSGTSFPSDVTADMVGRLVNRTDTSCIYRLKNANPVEWELVLDYSSPIPNGTYIAANYQPLSSKLTALTNVQGATNQVAYFTSESTMSSFPITSFGQSVLNTANAASLRTLYGLGALAVKDTVGTNDIQNGSITEAKLTFTPIRQGEGFVTGDIKQSIMNPGTGWILCSGTIGDASSGADYANANAETLFKTLWANQYIQILPTRGSTAQADWDAHKKLQLPTIINLFIYGTSAWIRL